MPVSNIIQIQDIHKSFGKHKALDNVNIKIKKGSIFGLLGPNGAGKTTLIRIINQIITPDRGIIKINGRYLRKETRLSNWVSPRRKRIVQENESGRTSHLPSTTKGIK